MSTSNFVTLVTGAAGALGSTLVEALVAGGHRVAALDRVGSAARLSELEASAPGACLAVPTDVTSAADWSAALERIERELGTPDGAVMTAGGWLGGEPFASEGGEAVWQAMMAVNLQTAEQSLRSILPGMIERRRGSIVLIGSRAAVRPWESSGAAAYAASKAALVAMAQAVAAEVLNQSVRVNVVLPSTLNTPANRHAMPSADASRWVEPSSLANVIGFLLSDTARDVSGAAIPVYGRA
jgi:NAD(P)-dependent dehydrogenase (short-subunit alcohol dehydrogenase family)